MHSKSEFLRSIPWFQVHAFALGMHYPAFAGSSISPVPCSCIIQASQGFRHHLRHTDESAVHALSNLRKDSSMHMKLHAYGARVQGSRRGYGQGTFHGANAISFGKPFGTFFQTIDVDADLAGHRHQGESPVGITPPLHPICCVA